MKYNNGFSHLDVYRKCFHILNPATPYLFLSSVKKMNTEAKVTMEYDIPQIIREAVRQVESENDIHGEFLKIRC